MSGAIALYLAIGFLMAVVYVAFAICAEALKLNVYRSNRPKWMLQARFLILVGAAFLSFIPLGTVLRLEIGPPKPTGADWGASDLLPLLSLLVAVASTWLSSRILHSNEKT